MPFFGITNLAKVADTTHIAAVRRAPAATPTTTHAASPLARDTVTVPAAPGEIKVQTPIYGSKNAEATTTTVNHDAEIGTPAATSSTPRTPVDAQTATSLDREILNTQGAGKLGAKPAAPKAEAPAAASLSAKDVANLDRAVVADRIAASEAFDSAAIASTAAEIRSAESGWLQERSLARQDAQFAEQKDLANRNDAFAKETAVTTPEDKKAAEAAHAENLKAEAAKAQDLKASSVHQRTVQAARAIVSSRHSLQTSASNEQRQAAEQQLSARNALGRDAQAHGSNPTLSQLLENPQFSKAMQTYGITTPEEMGSLLEQVAQLPPQAIAAMVKRLNTGFALVA